MFLLAGRNNPLIPLLGISFDTYNLLHRWFGRIVILEAIAHTIAHLAKGGWEEALPGIFKSPFLLWGFIVRSGSYHVLRGPVLLTLENRPLSRSLSSEYRRGAHSATPFTKSSS